MTGAFLFAARLIGSLAIGGIAVSAWAFGPKESGSGNNLVLAIPATVAAIAGYLLFVRNLSAKHRPGAWNLVEELNYVMAGAFVAALVIFFVTFEGS